MIIKLKAKQQSGVIKTRKRKRILLLLFMILLTAGFAANTVFAEDGLYPDLPEAAQESGDENLIRYRDNYYLDTVKMGITDAIPAMFAGMANALLSFQKGLATIQITVLGIAMDANALELFEGLVPPFVDSMKIYLFEGFATFFISVCGLVLLIRFVTNRQAQAVSGLFQVLLILSLAYLFYNHPVELLKNADEVVQEVSGEVLQAPYEAVNGAGSGDSLEGKVSSLVWTIMVHKPWQIAEFGSVQKANVYEQEILIHAPESDERKNAVKELASSENLFSKSASWQIERITTLVFIGIINLVVFLCLTLLSGMIFAYQFLILVYMILGIFVFLLALLPYFGIELIKRWGIRILAACSTKILLAFFFSLLIVFMSAIYTFIDTKGLLYTLFVMVAMIAILYLKRKEIASMFTGFRAANTVASEIYHAGDAAWNMGTGNLSYGPYNPYAGQQSSRMRGNTRSESSAGSGAASAPPSAPAAAMISQNGQESAAAMKDAADSIKKTTQDLNRYYKKAEELLQKQYEKSKAESEEDAQRKGEAPQYGAFVRRSDAVRSLGAGQFDQRDISSVARILQRVEKSGGDMNRVIAGSEKELHTQARRPSSLSDRGGNSGEAAHGTADDSDQAKPQQQAKRGVEFFRENFGEEKGEEFYSAMTRKFDTIKVDSFSSTDKLTYAQVQRQLKEKEKGGVSERKEDPPAKMRGGEHGNQE